MILFCALILQAGEPTWWKEAFQYGPTIVLLFMILLFLIRIAPIWKEVRLSEIAARTDEAQAKREQASALGQLATVLQSVAVEQRRATETIEILQRVNADSSDRLSQNVHSLNERLDRLETTHNSEQQFLAGQILHRIESLEKNVGTEATTARA
jgi:hypothetical protein